MQSKKRPEAGAEKENKEKASDIKKALEQEKEKAEKYLANWQRAEADIANYKKRTDQEKSDLAASNTAGIILNLLPVIDDFTRAFQAIPEDQQDQVWVDGMRLIERKLMSYMESIGLCKIESIGVLFDPNLHEAACHIEGDEGKIVEEFRAGYKLRGRLLRPPMVAVGKGNDSHESEEQES
ncbi:nucleotide exchange factor GrpE [Chloroflexota bacterium]